MPDIPWESVLLGDAGTMGSSKTCTAQPKSFRREEVLYRSVSLSVRILNLEWPRISRPSDLG